MSIVDALRCTNKVGADHDCASCKWQTVEFCDQYPDVPIPADCEINGRGAWVQCDAERIIDSAADLLEKLMEDTADVAPVVHGHWTRSRFTLQDRYQERCSVCENWSSDYGRYCPYCGAKMDEKQNPPR